MTREHFEAIAAVMAKTRPEDPEDGCYEHLTLSEFTALDAAWNKWEVTVALLADMCDRFNPGFSHQRFLDACEA